MTTTSERTDRCTGDGQVFPEGLAEMPPGPVLAEVLGRWMPRLAALPHARAGQLLAAQARQANYTDAVTLAVAWDIACRFHDPDDPCAHAAEPGRGAVALVALLCGWSEPVARARLELARAVLVRFPQLHAAMLAGGLDSAAARAYATATRDYPDDLARHVVSTVFGDGSPKTAAEIEDEILRTATGADPALIEALAKAAAARRTTEHTAQPGRVGEPARPQPSGRLRRVRHGRDQRPGQGRPPRRRPPHRGPAAPRGPARPGLAQLGSAHRRGDPRPTPRHSPRPRPRARPGRHWRAGSVRRPWSVRRP